MSTNGPIMMQSQEYVQTWSSYLAPGVAKDDGLRNGKCLTTGEKETNPLKIYRGIKLLGQTLCCGLRPPGHFVVQNKQWTLISIKS